MNQNDIEEEPLLLAQYRIYRRSWSIRGFLAILFISLPIAYYCATQMSSSHFSFAYGNSTDAGITDPEDLTRALRLMHSLARTEINRLTYQRTLYVLNGSFPNIRLTNVRSCQNRDPVTVRIGSRILTGVEQAPYLECPWPIHPKCEMVGFYGSAYMDPVPPTLPPNAEILDGKGNWKSLELVDARLPLVKPHKLAVCLQTIYLMADWTLLPQFFESWIGQGATYFLIYVQTVSPEFASLLQTYIDDRHDGVEVVVVPWAPFPDGGLDDDDIQNPNNQAYRTEVASSINDCILRARPMARYVVSSDLDEILVSMKADETLLDLIDRYIHQKLEGDQRHGALMFKNSFAIANNNLSELTHPMQFSFESFRNFLITRRVWPYSQRSKIVMIPEAIRRAHVHDVLEMDNPLWVKAAVLDDEGRVLHFRKVNASIINSTELYMESPVLADKVDQWSINFQERMHRASTREQESETGLHLIDFAQHPTVRYTMSDEKWPNRGDQVIAEMEICRLDNNDDKYRWQECKTQWTCKDKLTTVAPNEWVVAEDKWVVV